MVDGHESEPGDLPDEVVALPEWSRLKRDVAVVLWCAFLVASAGTMLLFAFVDPELLAAATQPPLELDRMSGYALGFFFLWVLTSASAALSVYLIRTRRRYRKTAA